MDLLLVLVSLVLLAGSSLVEKPECDGPLRGVVQSHLPFCFIWPWLSSLLLLFSVLRTFLGSVRLNLL